MFVSGLPAHIESDISSSTWHMYEAKLRLNRIVVDVELPELHHNTWGLFH